MSKFLLIKIIGGFIAIAIVAGGISVWVKTHHSSVIVKEAEKILPARVNPLLKRSNEVYWFYGVVFQNAHTEDGPNTNYLDCYLEGGFIPNAEMKKELLDSCKITAVAVMQDAHKRGYFKKSILKDWLDQRLIKKLFIEDEYMNHKGSIKRSSAQDKKYKEPQYLKKEAEKIVKRWFYPENTKGDK